MAKPIISYALCRGWGAFEVLGVTSESYGQLHGRILHDNRLTHKAKREIIHRFPDGTTEEDALGASRRYDAEYKRHTPGIEQAAKTLRDLQNQREFAAMDAAKTPVKRGVRTLPGQCPVCMKVSGDDGSQCKPDVPCLLQPPAPPTAQCDRLIRGLDCLCGTPTAGLGDASHVRCEHVHA